MTDFHAQDFSSAQKMYVLVEFPYPSGAGLHIGHAFTFTGGDVYARFQRMQGKNVLFPIGYDAFGLPTENYAIRSGRKPQEVARENNIVFHNQMDRLGLSFDWERVVDTTDPAYYRWTQWIFIKLFEKGLAYKAEMPINWCPSCKVGLANEEVIDGRCERCGAETERRNISQWVVRITDYADRLIYGLSETNFIEKVKAAQINWVGRSEGARIRFPISGKQDHLEVFTTRPDTLWGCTFMVIAPEHPLVEEAMGNPAISAYVTRTRARSEQERIESVLDKDGIFSGFMATHPATGKEIPIWISDFVLGSYGTGAIMAVPAHDDRDFAFAQKYQLPILPVIIPEYEWDFNSAAFTGLDGRASRSGPIDGLSPKDAIPASIQWLVEKGVGEGAVSYHLRDWIFSRQHYWGEPIPMIFCQSCGWVPVPDDQLPVILPVVDAYKPTDTGESPLAAIHHWVEVACPKCGEPARRETDTMPNWAGSDWYFLRYTDPQNSNCLASLEKQRYWMPVDIYVGGDEHNTLHLLYSRFIYQFLHDIGAVPAEIPEPYQKRLSHGVILGPDGKRMSKTRGNVIVPDEYVDRYGADTLRMYLLFMGPYDATMAWNERAVLGVKRFLDRVERFFVSQPGGPSRSGDRVRTVINHLGKVVANDTESLNFNTAIAMMMETLNTLEEYAKAGEQFASSDLRIYCQVLAPYAPFLAESLWKKSGGKGSVHKSAWPAYDPSLEVIAGVDIAVQVNGKLRGLVHVPVGVDETYVRHEAESVESISRHLEGKKVVRVVFIPNRTLNYVVS